MATVSAALAAGLLAPPAHADGGGPLTELVDAAAQRLQVAEDVAAAKWHTHGAIEDPARVRDMLDKLSAGAVAAHIDPSYVSTVFADQISATEAIEYRRFSEWKLDATDVPAAPPDLSVSRSTIDRLNQTMLAQIALDWTALHSPECAGQLAAAQADAVAGRRLDELYRQALLTATRSYCQG